MFEKFLIVEVCIFKKIVQPRAAQGPNSGVFLVDGMVRNVFQESGFEVPDIFTEAIEGVPYKKQSKRHDDVQSQVQADCFHFIQEI